MDNIDKYLIIIKNVFKVSKEEIKNIKPLEKGMTNDSFIFTVENKDYVFRIPGVGTDMLITRVQEAAVYRAIEDLHIADDVVYIDANTGYKISHYYTDTENVNAFDISQVKASMAILRRLHNSDAKVKHQFNPIHRLTYFEKLCSSVKVRKIIKPKGFLKVISFLKKNFTASTLCHIDPNAYNFLVLKSGEIKLIDWEYAGMSDPIIDVAMFAIYQSYSEKEVDDLLLYYLEREPSSDDFRLYYAYIALSSYLWHLWSLYKEALGDDLIDYRNMQLNYSKLYTEKFNNL